ncbi:hypothetical protein J7I98_33945 [Streptomyces sp. ISL-98]|uniref:hypothetical protein n=1 Tax=Streptomyces sp. ISL-98 TaxID=2819192 RepID=UPI001BEA2024|nr:hypothetical protein [Streptomyces sp. ISL-98]MBT2510742.1 hypothetical protein [Streptomyces sp. ISL-98]
MQERAALRPRSRSPVQAVLAATEPKEQLHAVRRTGCAVTTSPGTSRQRKPEQLDPFAQEEDRPTDALQDVDAARRARREDD